MTNPHEQAVLVKVAVKKWSGVRKDTLVTEEVERLKSAAPGSGKYVKNLIDPKALGDVKVADNNIRETHYKYTRPWIDDGRRLLPLSLKAEYDKQMLGAISNFDQAVGGFIARYPGLISEAQGSLGEMFDLNEYPSEGELRAMFGVDIRHEPVPSGAGLPMTTAERDELVSKIEHDAKEALKASADELFHRTVKAVREVSRKIKQYDEALEADDPKARSGKRLRPELMNELAELVELLPHLNLEGDKFLEGVVERTKAELLDTDVEKLTEDKGARDKAMAEVDKILADAGIKA